MRSHLPISCFAGASSPIPAAAPARIRSTRDLRSLQRLMAAAVCRPLSPADRTQRRWSDGRSTASVIGTFAKPNPRLSALERVEIYNRMYWFRVLDSLREDFPGLRALLGERRFLRLARVYLEHHPSRSFTLRDLGQHLSHFIRAHPSWTAPRTAAAHDLARFEWAQIVAFDAAARPAISAAALRLADPLTLRLALQPCLTLLEAGHAIDDYVLAVKRRDASLRSAASQTVRPTISIRVRPRAPRLRRELTHLAVHRFDNQIYYRRLTPAEFRLLRALACGRPLADACARAFRGSRTPPAEQAAAIREWFERWTQLGWLCARE